MNGPAFVAGGEASEMLEAIETPLDAVAMLVDDRIVRDDDLAGTVRGDDRLGVHGLDRRPQGIAVIGFIAEYGLARLSIEKSGSLRDVANLARRHDEAQGTTERIGQHMDLGRQSASGTPQRLILGPPFPLAAC